jgi:hypothetical protein
MEPMKWVKPDGAADGKWNNIDIRNIDENKRFGEGAGRHGLISEDGRYVMVRTYGVGNDLALHEGVDFFGQVGTHDELVQHYNASGYKWVQIEHYERVNAARQARLAEQEKVNRDLGLQQEELKANREKLARDAKAVGQHMVVAEIPNTEDDSEVQIASDQLRSEIKANILYQGQVVQEKLKDQIKQTKSEINSIKDHGAEGFRNEGAYNSTLEPNQSGQSAAIRAGNLKAHEFEEAQDELLEELTSDQKAAKKLAKKSTQAAAASVDYVYDHNGESPLEKLEKLKADLETALEMAEKWEKKAGQLEKANKASWEAGIMEGSVQKKALVALVAICFIGMLAMAGVIAHGKGWAPLQNIQITAGQLKALEYAGVGLAALGVGAGVIYGAKKGAPVVWRGIQAGARKIAA